MVKLRWRDVARAVVYLLSTAVITDKKKKKKKKKNSSQHHSDHSGKKYIMYIEVEAGVM